MLILMRITRFWPKTSDGTLQLKGNWMVTKAVFNIRLMKLISKQRRQDQADASWPQPSALHNEYNMGSVILNQPSLVFCLSGEEGRVRATTWKGGSLGTRQGESAGCVCRKECGRSWKRCDCWQDGSQISRSHLFPPQTGGSRCNWYDYILS